MYRFLIFGGARFYARGGFNDLVGGGDNLETAIKKAEDLLDGKTKIKIGEDFEWYHIVDVTTGQIVKKSKALPLGGLPSNASSYHRIYQDGNLVSVEVTEKEDDDEDET